MTIEIQTENFRDFVEQVDPGTAYAMVLRTRNKTDDIYYVLVTALKNTEHGLAILKCRVRIKEKLRGMGTPPGMDPDAVNKGKDMIHEMKKVLEKKNIPLLPGKVKMGEDVV